MKKGTEYEQPYTISSSQSTEKPRAFLWHFKAVHILSSFKRSTHMGTGRVVFKRQPCLNGDIQSRASKRQDLLVVPGHQ